MKRILFVDDEESVLHGLRRMLRSHRRGWEMHFVTSGEEALKRLATDHFDVIVTDMRMPGMDGAELLAEVMQQYPTLVRIVLSGQCDRGKVLEIVELTHQFLSKPCDSELLGATIARTCALCDLLPDEWQKCLVLSVVSIPSVPSAYAELVAELGRPAASLRRVCEIVSQDPGMAAKVMQLVSSGFFGVPQCAAGPAQAVSLLGLDTIRPLALGSPAISPGPLDPWPGRSLERLVEHSQDVAAVAAAIARFETGDPQLVGDALLGGLLHDVGQLVLADHLAGRYEAVFDAACDQRIALWEAEQQALNTTHAEIGACVMGLWGLPERIVDALAGHHRPAACADRSFSPLTAVHVANVVVNEQAAEQPRAADALDMEYLERIGLVHRIDPWRRICSSALPEGVLP